LSGASLVGLQPARGDASVLLCLMRQGGAVQLEEGKDSNPKARKTERQAQETRKVRKGRANKGEKSGEGRAGNKVDGWTRWTAGAAASRGSVSDVVCKCT
jgi:hypothetical protein